MKKLSTQPNEQFVSYEITDSIIIELKPYLDNAIYKANKVILNDDEDSFQSFTLVMVHTPYNSGYIENRFQFDLSEENKNFTMQKLLESFKYPTELFTWELYLDNQILIGCNHIQGILNINKLLLK